jgi:hypothetical protein
MYIHVISVLFIYLVTKYFFHFKHKSYVIKSGLCKYSQVKLYR